MQKPLTERITDVYLITMLALFPLFFGFSGYSNITTSKFVFLLAATGLWLAGLLTAALLKRSGSAARCPAQAAALALVCVAVISWLCCGDLKTSFLGAGRFDGLLSTLVYVLIFLGVSAFGRIEAFHFRLFAFSISLTLLVALAQIAGCDLLKLFPRGLSFFDAGVRYSGVFLSTIGNTNILDAILCLALPLFLSLYVCGVDWFPLVPLALAVPVLWKAGGDGLKVSAVCTALVLPGVLLTGLPRVRRALRALGLLLLIGALAQLWQPEQGAPLRFVFSLRAAVLLPAGAVCAALSFVPLPERFAPTPDTLRRFFLIGSAAAVILGLLAVLLVPWQSGTLYELSQVLRGHAEDSFGSNRILIWRGCLELVPARPLLGCGPGMLADRLDISFSRFVPETGETLRASVDNAHNVYLGALVNTGVLGLGAYLAVLAFSAVTALRRRKDLPRLCLSMGLLCASVHAFFGLGLCLSEPLYWLGLGLLCSAETKTSVT